ncbi:hypothetical protein CRU99_13080 [Malaciobacter mytili]|uniref:hypothetical protein n=1 Tax=Malaciobacter mytili TaxID=603050 RepID=UPI00100B3819|nr:hypothetical protein [Malaciobacter mytili]RXI36934.1 hypothetical protein CRU99_13080 [Malaciobacter mytili]
MTVNIFLLFFLLIIVAYLMQKYDKKLSLKNCIYDKFLIPFINFINKKNVEDIIEIQQIKDNHIVINSQHKTLYAIELSGFDTIEQPLSELTVENLFDFASKDPKGYFFQAILKDGSYQKQYIFSYSKDVVEIIAKSLNIKLLKGKEIVDVLFDLFLDNSFYIKNKKIFRQLNISEDTTVSLSSFETTFNKIMKNNTFNNLNTMRVYQCYQIKKKYEKIDYNALYNLDFTGVIWGYYDFNKERAIQYANNLVTQRKFYGGKEPFVNYEKLLEKGTKKVLTVNFEFVSKDSNLSIINKISEILGISFTIKRNKLTNTLIKTPLKFRDTRFDLPCTIDFLKGRISTVHKKSARSPDFFGVDSKNAHTNFGFADENANPHSIIIAPTGTGKSVAKQKITSQMLEIDFKTGFAAKLGLTSYHYGIRNFDVGYSDRPTFELLKSNKKNSIGEIHGDLKYFSFNVVNFELDENGEPLTEDIQFASDILSMILESQGGDSLNTILGLSIKEAGLFRKIVKMIYKKKDYEEYKVRKLKKNRINLYNELVALGYTDNTKLQDIKEEEYDYLKSPLLKDILNYAIIEKSNQLIDELERLNYANLAIKLESINQLGYFSDFDNIKITDTAYIYAELNSIKESNLFVPMFFGIFWKIYIKDRNRALKLKKLGLARPKLIYEIEEASNHFRFKTFVTMFEKLVYEARKYNIHMMFIIQNAEEVPYTIFKNINTRIFLLPPDQKEDIISYIEKELKASPKVIESLKKSKEYDLIIWYNKGVINIKLQYSDNELEFFTTNPNEINKSNECEVQSLNGEDI